MTSYQKIYFSFQLPQSWLDSVGLNQQLFLSEMAFLVDCFGTRYLKFFASNITTISDAEIVHETATLLKPIKDVPGFSRFVKYFDVKNINASAFPARLAAILFPHFQLELEPEPDSGARPDIRVTSKEGIDTFFECKTINNDVVRKHYDLDGNKRLADKISSDLITEKQINVFCNNSDA